MKGEYFYDGQGYVVYDVKQEKHYTRYILGLDNSYLVISERRSVEKTSNKRPK